VSLDTGSSKINLGMKTLRFRWEETKGHWKDSVSRDFEDNYWTPLETQVLATLRVVDRLAQAMAKAKQECS
jgi:hypothetical protein